jgi:GH24 family phage-related lysozyme (muramidase)
MPLGDNYLNAIRGFEGFSRRPRWDYRQWSSGYGTRANSPDEEIDEPEADRRFRAGLTGARDSVRGFGVAMTPGQEAALTSLTYNAGPRWMRSGLGEAVRAGDWRTAQERFLQYVNAGGRPLPGLRRRREQEAAWLNAPAPGGGAPFGGPAPTPVAAPVAQQPQQPVAPEAGTGDGTPWWQSIGAGLGGAAAALNPLGTAQAQTPPDDAPKGTPRNPLSWEEWLQIRDNPQGRTPYVRRPDGTVGIERGQPVQQPATAPAPPEAALAPPQPGRWEAPEVALAPPSFAPAAREVVPPQSPLNDPLTPRAPGPILMPRAPIPAAGKMGAPAPFGAPVVTPAEEPEDWNGVNITGDIVRRLNQPQPPDADAIVRGAENAAAERASQPQQPGYFERLMSNPAFLAGLSILGTAPGGNWGPAGAQAASQAIRGRREQAEYERLQGRRTTMDRVWREAFGANGQPNAGHPLMQGLPPEMASTIYAMGPEEGLPALQRWQFFRGQQAEQLRIQQAQQESTLRMFGLGGQQQSPPPADGSHRAQAGLPEITGERDPFGSLFTQPGTPQTPPAPQAAPGNEPVVRIGQASLPVSVARALAASHPNAGVRETLNAAIQAADRQSQAPSGFRYRPDGSLEAVPGGPGEQISAEVAGRLAMMQTAQQHLGPAREFFTRAWGPGDVGQALFSAGDYNRHRRSIRVAIEGALRATTGAAAPESEVAQYMDMFLPQMTDSRATAMQKLSLLEAFMANAQQIIMRGRGSSLTPGGGDGFSIRRLN